MRSFTRIVIIGIILCFWISGSLKAELNDYTEFGAQLHDADFIATDCSETWRIYD